jgi:hypothetical protein
MEATASNLQTQEDLFGSPQESNIPKVVDFHPPADIRTKAGNEAYRSLDAFARTRLSKHFIMRDFLFSSHSACQGIPIVPDNPEHVIKAGKALCEKILEPVLAQFGMTAITYGYQNREGMESGWSSKEKATMTRSSDPHHWDRGTFREGIYARVDILPFCVEDGYVSKRDFGLWVMHNLDVCLLMQYPNSNVSCITISPKPRRVFLEWGYNTEGRMVQQEIIGVGYWNSIFPTLDTKDRPKFYPSHSGGRVRWGAS